MKHEWSIVLSIDYLTSIKLLGYIRRVYKTLFPFMLTNLLKFLLNAGGSETIIPPRDLSFATSFIIAVFIYISQSKWTNDISIFNIGYDWECK